MLARMSFVFGWSLVLISLGGILAETAYAQGPPRGDFRRGDSGERGGWGGDRGRDRGDDDRGRDRGRDDRDRDDDDRGRGGDDRGRGGDDRGRGGFPDFDPADMLRRFDRNRSGTIEADEMEGRSGEFLKRLLSGTGLENSSSIKVDQAAEAIQKAREAREQGIQSASMTFGTTSDLQPAAGFDAPPPLSLKALEEKYGKSVVDSTTGMMQRYDKNKNFYLDGNEWGDVRWYGGDPTSYDSNKDGRLSMEELSARTAGVNQSRDGDDNRRESGRDDRGGSRGSNEDSGRGGDRDGDRGGSEERGRGFGGRSFGGGPPGGGPGGFGGFGGGPPGGGPGGRSGRSGFGGFFGGGGGEEGFKNLASMLMRRLDQNENDFIDGDELKGVMGGDPLETDKNKDGKLSLDELTERTKNFAERGGPGGRDRGGDRGDDRSRRRGDSSEDEKDSKPISYRFLSPYERLPASLPDWFRESDRDEDGQVMMHEYSATWSTSRVAEFAEYDLNRDGVITAEECLQAEGIDSSQPSRDSRDSRGSRFSR